MEHGASSNRIAMYTDIISYHGRHTSKKIFMVKTLCDSITNC